MISGRGGVGNYLLNLGDNGLPTADFTWSTCSSLIPHLTGFTIARSNFAK